MPSKARTQFCSTPNAIAKGRYFSNIWGVLTIRRYRSDSTRFRNSSKPSTFSKVRVPRSVRAGMNHWATYTWNPDAEGDFDGNFEVVAEMSFDEVLCGSVFGAPADTC